LRPELVLERLKRGSCNHKIAGQVRRGFLEKADRGVLPQFCTHTKLEILDQAMTKTAARQTHENKMQTPLSSPLLPSPLRGYA